MEAELVYKVLEFPFTEGHQPTDFVKTVHAVRGISGAVSFIYVPRPVDDTGIVALESRVGAMWPMGVDVGYHRRVRTGEYQHENLDCDVIGSGICYYDGSGLRATEWLEEWILTGYNPDWMRQKLADYYHDVFYELIGEDKIAGMGLGETLHLLGQLLGGTE